MKRILLFLLFTITCLWSFGQEWQGRRVIARDGVFIKNAWLENIINDTAQLSSLDSARSVLTSKALFDAIRKYSGTSVKLKNAGSGASVKTVGDSLRVDLGGQLNENVTHIYIPVGRQTDQSTIAQSKTFVITNKPYTGTAGTDWGYWNERGNNSLLVLERMFDEANNDVAPQQYNGIFKTFSRLKLDRYSTRFRYDNEPIKMQDMGISSAAQLYAPQDSVHLQPSPNGYSGSAAKFTTAFGDFYGYNIAIKGFPHSTTFSEVDFHRVIDDNYSKRMSGTVVNYLAGWKAHQVNINSGTIEAGSRKGQVYDFYSYGDFYPNIGAAVDKEKVLRVSRVDSAFGFYSAPKRTANNQVVRGYGFVQDGTEDLNHMAGKLRIRGTRPDWVTDFTNDMPYDFEVQGKSRFTDSLVTTARVRHQIIDTAGAATPKNGPLLVTQLTRRFLDQKYTQSQNSSASRIILDFEARDSVIINTNLNSVSAAPADESRMVIRALSGGVAPATYITTNGGARYPQAVRNSYLMVGAAGQKKLGGYWANYSSGLDVYNSTDSIEWFMNYAANNGNILNGYVGNSVVLYGNTNPMAANDWYLYQPDNSMKSLVNGAMSIRDITSDTVRMTAVLPKTDSSNYLVSTAHLKKVLADFEGGLPEESRAFVDSLQSGLVSDSSYLAKVSGSVYLDTVKLYTKPYGAASYTGFNQFTVPKYQVTDLVQAGTNITRAGTGTPGDAYVFSISTSPVFTGNPEAPTQTYGVGNNRLANTQFVNQSIANYSVFQATNSAASATLTLSGTAYKNIIPAQNLSVNITSITDPGAPAYSNTILIAFSDNGTARTISGWPSSIRVGDIPLPTTTVVGKVTWCQIVFNMADSKWDFVGLTNINK